MVAHVDEGNANIIQHMDDLWAKARKDGSNYHLYVRLVQQRAAEHISLDEDNEVASLSMIGHVEKAIKETHAEHFSTQGLRVCISSSASDSSLTEKGADIMVYSGKGSQYFDVDLGAWSTESDSPVKTRLPAAVVVCTEYGPRSTAELFAASPLAKYTRIIVWRRQGPETTVWQKFIRPIVAYVVNQHTPEEVKEFVEKCARTEFDENLCGVIIPEAYTTTTTERICDTELEADKPLICERVPKG